MFCNWKDRRIDAINKLLRNNKGKTKYLFEKYIEEYQYVLASKANNKREYKMERLNND
jgi:hypothetical protein